MPVWLFPTALRQRLPLQHVVADQWCNSHCRSNLMRRKLLWLNEAVSSASIFCYFIIMSAPEIIDDDTTEVTSRRRPSRIRVEEPLAQNGEPEEEHSLALVKTSPPVVVTREKKYALSEWSKINQRVIELKKERKRLIAE